MDPQKITELAKLFRCNGDKILSSEFTLTLSGSLLRALNDSFTLITDSVKIRGPQQQFEVTKPINTRSSTVFYDLQLVHDFVQKTTILCIIHYPTEEYFTGSIDISKFRSLKRLELRKVHVKQIVGIQSFRSQLQHLICIKSIDSIEDIITHCGGDNSNGFVWNELKIADFSYNNLHTVDTSLEFAQYLQQLNLRHNKLFSVEALKWLPHLKSLDLSSNCLQCIPQFHKDAYKRLQTLNMSNNYIEDLLGISKMDALTELDLSDNCLLDHTNLLPISALMTLNYLNLYGNPLACHPKHRLATAQFLHKNTSTVKFLLDLEPLSKSEKAITGKHQLRYGSSLSRYTLQSSSASIDSSKRGTPSTQTPSSSIGSLQSFKFQDKSETSDIPVTTRKKSTKIRMVEIEDDKTTKTQTDEKDNSAIVDNEEPSISSENKNKIKDEKKKKNALLTQSLLNDSCTEHLETKKHIETLRVKYGSEWLQTGKAEMIQSVLGIEASSSTLKNDEEEREASKSVFKEYLDVFTGNTGEQQDHLNENDSGIRTSTPLNELDLKNLNQEKGLTYTPIKVSQNDDTLYHSVDNNTQSNKSDENSFYKTANDTNSTESSQKEQIKTNENDEKEDLLKNIYSNSFDVESEDSEPEEEETYIVYPENSKTALFLTLSQNCLRVKDTWTQKTKTKWSLKILESCERIKSNKIRIHFDTVKADKRERIYIVEDDLCQDLEKKLRNILSKRDLSEMNQKIYRCVNCSCQFSRENKIQTFPKQELRCPECNSIFIAEIQDIPKSLERHVEKIADDKLSPAAIVEEYPDIKTPSLVKPASLSAMQSEDSVEAESSNSIGSANSLNESSSCSKISAQSQSSFNSNQSIVGSTNSERDLEFNVNGESDVDIISNPSQSSIEVLDQVCYDGRISQQPNLETIDDNSYKQSHSNWPNDIGNNTSAEVDSGVILENTSMKAIKNGENQTKIGSTISPLTHLQLTESSSSGSVTDSVCTAYSTNKAKSNKEKTTLNNFLTSERSVKSEVENKENLVNTNRENTKKEDTGLSSMFGAIFQSTNILMSSSKKLIDAEATATIKTGEKLPIHSDNKTAKSSNRNVVPYKFNYIDFNDIDHRLKLYFYQTKFEADGERFKWLVRGRIYNENTRTLFSGIVAISTSRLFLMEAFAPESDIVTNWLKPIVSVSMDRLESVQLLPWKIGYSFNLRNWGNFLLLLQDIPRTESLLAYFSNNNLPIQCQLLHQPAECITTRLNDAVESGEKLNIFALLNGCEISCDNAKRTFQICGLLATDAHLYLTTNKLNWLSQTHSDANCDPDDYELERCVMQLMSNLVDVENIDEHVRVINFLDETENKCEIWRLTFETKENADCCLHAIGEAWEKLFGVSLFGT